MLAVLHDLSTGWYVMIIPGSLASMWRHLCPPSSIPWWSQFQWPLSLFSLVLSTISCDWLLHGGWTQNCLSLRFQNLWPTAPSSPHRHPQTCTLSPYPAASVKYSPRSPLFWLTPLSGWRLAVLPYRSLPSFLGTEEWSSGRLLIVGKAACKETLKPTTPKDSEFKKKTKPKNFFCYVSGTLLPWWFSEKIFYFSPRCLKSGGCIQYHGTTKLLTLSGGK